MNARIDLPHLTQPATSARKVAELKCHQKRFKLDTGEFYVWHFDSIHDVPHDKWNHVAGSDNLPLSEDEKNLARALGKRLAQVALKLAK